jgi:hypothetical protein
MATLTVLGMLVFRPNVDARHNTINVKKTAMVLRSVGSIVRALPAHKLVRLRRKQPTSFSIDYALYPSVCASLSTRSCSRPLERGVFVPMDSVRY